MKWSLGQLYRYKDAPLEFSGEIDYSDYLNQCGDILHMDIVMYQGTVQRIGEERYKFNLSIKTMMYLEDARTLDEVALPIDLNITEIFGKDINADEERYIEKNTIDLYDIIWENILLEKPIRITKE